MPRLLRARATRDDSPFVLSHDRLAGIVTQSRTDGAAVTDSFQLRHYHPRAGTQDGASGSELFAAAPHAASDVA